MQKSTVEASDEITGESTHVVNKACFAMLWVKSVSNAVVKQRIINDLKSRDGIEDAHYSESGPLRLIVRYAGDQLFPSQIQDMVSRDGVRAVIVGC